MPALRRGIRDRVAVNLSRQLKGVLVYGWS
jgi:hypothetical protein